ncbi:MAG: hypothetical protein IT532_15090 [Burkholderiales bacterium]|nr:hypothetical protein [Burkholderiales bacterium]
MPSFSQNAVMVALLVGVIITLLLTLRNLIANRRLFTLLEEQALAIQKLSAEMFEIQNLNSDVTRSLNGTTQGTARIEKELQALGAMISTIRSAPAGSGEGLLHLSKEIKKTLQSREVSDFLDNASRS